MLFILADKSLGGATGAIKARMNIMLKKLFCVFRMLSMALSLAACIGAGVKEHKDRPLVFLLFAAFYRANSTILVDKTAPK